MAFHLCAFVPKFLCVQVFIMEQKSLNLIHSETGQMHLITKTTCDPGNCDCQRLGPPRSMHHWLVHVEKAHSIYKYRDFITIHANIQWKLEQNWFLQTGSQAIAGVQCFATIMLVEKKGSTQSSSVTSEKKLIIGDYPMEKKKEKIIRRNRNDCSHPMHAVSSIISCVTTTTMTRLRTCFIFCFGQVSRDFVVLKMGGMVF